MKLVQRFIAFLITRGKRREGVPNPEASVRLVERLWNDHINFHLRRLGLAALCMILVAAATAGNAWLLQPVLDGIFLKNDTSLLLALPIAILALAALKGAGSYGQMVMMKYVGQRITTDMQLSLYRHLLSSDIALFSANSSGKLISRFSNDVQIIRRNLTNFLSNFAKEIVTLVFLVAVMFYQSASLALIAFTVFPIAVLPVVRLGKKMRRVATRTQEEMGQFTASLDDTFQAIRIVKACTNEELESAKAKTAMEKLFQLYIRAAKLESASSPIMEALSGIAIAAVVWYGGWQVIEGHTTPGAFFSFIGALIMAYKPIKSLSGLTANTQEGLAAVARYYAMMDTKPTIRDMKNAKPLKLKKGTVQFKQVQFAYNDEADVLHGISLDVAAGSKVALVGESGGGKSTILNLILRFYDPSKGSILLDGQDVKKVTLASLRKSVGIVTQESLLFDDSIRANIAYGKPAASEKDITVAAKAAAAHDFIQKLPQGYDTVIGQHGVRLSGGQRQRIAIARAMLKNAPILLLDEATSSLDTASESQVQQALGRLMKNRTTIVIAHRLSTVKDADKIYVISGGRVVEHGNHDALLKKKGEYSRLYARQFAPQEKKRAS
jgi:subfamily B ATP-binding cassette protein MsbA